MKHRSGFEYAAFSCGLLIHHLQGRDRWPGASLIRHKRVTLHQDIVGAAFSRDILMPRG